VVATGKKIYPLLTRRGEVVLSSKWGMQDLRGGVGQQRRSTRIKKKTAARVPNDILKKKKDQAGNGKLKERGSPEVERASH